MRRSRFSFYETAVLQAVNSEIAQLVFDAEQLVVFGNPVGAGERTGLDLSGIDCNGRGTSCPDQLAKALAEIKKQQKG